MRKTGQNPAEPQLSPRARVARWIRAAIDGGKIAPGEAVPPVRTLSAMLGVPVNTAAAAVVDAERDGLLIRRAPGARRRFVAPPGATLFGSTVCVLCKPSRFVGDTPAPRWSDPFISSEIFRRLADAGMHAFTLNGDTVRENDIETIFRLPPAGVVAIDSVFSSPIAARLLERSRRAGVPAVAYGNAPELRGFDRVYTDHRAGARDLVKWLVGRGCRRIVPLFPAFLSERQPHWVSERLAGYGEAMREAGLSPRPCAYFGSKALTGIDAAERFRLFTALALDELTALRREGGVDAVVCSCDEWAKPPIAAIRRLGLVPNGDILVAGYDNIVEATPFSAFEPACPAVTIDKHNEKTAAEMASLLLARIAGNLPGEPQCRAHAHELVQAR